MAQSTAIQVIRWQGGQHPTASAITRMMLKENLRPYIWMNHPNHRYAVRSHGYRKTLYVVEGSLDVTFPDSNQQVRLQSGDRIDIPAGIRHALLVGASGAKCMEASTQSPSTTARK